MSPVDSPVDPEFLGHVPLPADQGPTTRKQSVDLSREMARTSGNYRAWNGSVAESRDCACGSVIVARSPDPVHVRIAVRDHNLTERHSRWRKREGL